MKKKLSTGKKMGIGIAVFLVAGAIFSGGSKKDDVEKNTTTEVVTTTSTALGIQTPPATTTPPETKPQLTKSQENAVKTAESYLRYSSFSRSGLINQLKFEGYEEEDAKFAVDYIDVDWMEQAVRSGANYLELMSFSRSGLIKQLKFEGFTDKQAEHGADKNGY